MVLATHVTRAGPRTPGVEATFTLVVTAAKVGRNNELSHCCSRLCSSISHATPIAYAKVLGCLILTSNLISSFNPAMKFPIRNPSSKTSI